MNSILRLTSFACFVFACLPVFGQDDTNTMCPVLLDREATAEYSVTYKGKEVRFCCSECIIEFNKHPEIYEAVLPQLQQIPLRTQIQVFLADYGLMSIGSTLLLMLVGLRIYHVRHPEPDAESTFSKLLQFRISPAVPLLFLSGYLGYEVIHLQSELNDRRWKDEIHFATFHDFGFPPAPRRPDTEPRLSASFYRGNDERSPKLFNNGNYRTAAFHVSLCDESGQALQAGDSVKDRCVFLKFEIDRPPFTPDFLYDKSMMDTMFLTRECEEFLGRDQPVADELGLTETEPMQKWEALYPIKTESSCCCGDELSGTVYVCEKYYGDSSLPFVGKQRQGSRFHYGVRYDLSLVDGKIADTSDVYMGALYRTRKLPTWRVPMDQWFSHVPIPELPGENVADPELLGVTDHEAKINGLPAIE